MISPHRWKRSTVFVLVSTVLSIPLACGDDAPNDPAVAGAGDAGSPAGAAGSSHAGRGGSSSAGTNSGVSAGEGGLGSPAGGGNQGEGGSPELGGAGSSELAGGAAGVGGSGATVLYRLNAAVSQGQGSILSTSNPTQPMQIGCASVIDGSSSLPQLNGVCAVDFAGGTLVTLTATGDNLQVPNIWGGACSGAASTPCTVTMDQAQDVTVTFGYQVTLTPSVNGTVADPSGLINCGSACSAIYPPFSGLTFTSAPNAGLFFGHWTSSGPSCAATENPCTIVLDNPFTLTATYQAPLTLTTPGGGTLVGNSGGAGTPTARPCSPNCPTTVYDVGTPVTVTANPSTDFSIRTMAGNCTSSPCTLTMNTSQAVSAIFMTLVIVIRSPNQPTIGSLVDSTSTSGQPQQMNCGIEDQCWVLYDFNDSVRLVGHDSPPIGGGGGTVLEFFNGWVGCPSQVNFITCDVPVTKQTVVTAKFFQPAN